MNNKKILYFKGTCWGGTWVLWYNRPRSRKAVRS